MPYPYAPVEGDDFDSCVDKLMQYLKTFNDINLLQGKHKEKNIAVIKKKVTLYFIKNKFSLLKECNIIDHIVLLYVYALRNNKDEFKKTLNGKLERDEGNSLDDSNSKKLMKLNRDVNESQVKFKEQIKGDTITGDIKKECEDYVRHLIQYLRQHKSEKLSQLTAITKKYFEENEYLELKDVKIPQGNFVFLIYAALIGDKSIIRDIISQKGELV